MKFRTTFKDEDDAWEYGLGGLYIERGGNWEFKLDYIEEDCPDDMPYCDVDGYSYPEEFVELIED